MKEEVTHASSLVAFLINERKSEVWIAIGRRITTAITASLTYYLANKIGPTNADVVAVLTAGTVVTAMERLWFWLEQRQSSIRIVEALHAPRPETREESKAILSEIASEEPVMVEIPPVDPDALRRS